MFTLVVLSTGSVPRSVQGALARRSRSAQYRFPLLTRRRSMPRRSSPPGSDHHRSET